MVNSMESDDFEADLSFFELEPTTPRRPKPFSFYITPSPVQYNEASLSQLLEAEWPATTATTVIAQKPVDSRPIWPGRAEVIYETYLAVKFE